MTSIALQHETPDCAAENTPAGATPSQQDNLCQPVAKVRDLRVVFHRGRERVEALRGVDLEIAPGEVLGLVGESGSGKSALGLALLGLLPRVAQVSGSIEILGTEMTRAGAEAWRLARKRHLAAIFQDPMTSLNPTMRVGQQVAEAAGSSSAALKLLEEARIPDARHRLRSFPHQLSGGLRQRVMVAIAVAGPPRLVVADEPTTALDVTVQSQVLALLRRLCRELGTAMLFITHDLAVASQLADRVAVLYAGKLMELGPVSAVLSRSSHPYTQGLLRSRITLRTDRSRPIPALPGEPPRSLSASLGCPFSPRCYLADDQCKNSAPPPTPAGATLAACWHGSEAQSASSTSPLPDPWPTAPLGDRRTAVSVHATTKSFALRSKWRLSKRIFALREVDLEVAEGEAVAVVGESGSGKSTLLRAIAGLVSLDSGSVELGSPGKPQIVFQDAGASLTPWLSVGYLISERLVAAKVPRSRRAERVEAALAAVGLDARLASAKPRQLSGGQRQRVALARAIVVPPPLLLCDEPTSALDVSLAATVLNLVGELRRRLHMAVIFVTHDIAVARVVADRVAVMREGQVVEEGPVVEVTTSPRHPYTKALLACVPQIEGDAPTWQ